MFEYQVYSEAQASVERFNLLKDGEYDAVIEKSMDKISSSGNPMMDMTLSVFDENGMQYTIRDFLVFTPKMMWKIVNCAKSANVIEQYESQNFCSELMESKRVRVKISTEKGGIILEDKLKGKSFGSKYPDKNKIEDYISIYVNKFNDDDIAF
jgi:hypothetical protein